MRAWSSGEPRGSLWGAEAGGPAMWGGPVVAGGGESGLGRREGPRPRGEGVCACRWRPRVCRPGWASRCWRPAGAARPAAAGFLRLGAPLAAAGDARNGPFCVWGRVRARPGREGFLFLVGTGKTEAWASLRRPAKSSLLNGAGEKTEVFKLPWLVTV